jgi:hypothetical protein
MGTGLKVLYCINTVSFGPGRGQAWLNVMMDIEDQFFLDVILCNIAEKHSYFAETYCPYLECHLLYPEAEGSKFIHEADNYLKDKQHHIPEGSMLQTAIRPLNFTIDIVNCLTYKPCGVQQAGSAGTIGL